jgi:hypothetical protein
MSLTVDIDISIGLYECIIELKPEDNKERYFVQLKRKATYTDKQLLYSAQFTLVWDETTQTLTSPRTKNTPPDPAHWVELLEKISGHIMANR